MLFVYNCNPLATMPNQNRVLQGLERADLFTVVFEQVFTDTARFADVLLPPRRSWKTTTSRRRGRRLQLVRVSAVRRGTVESAVFSDLAAPGHWRGRGETDNSSGSEGCRQASAGAARAALLRRRRTADSVRRHPADADRKIDVSGDSTHRPGDSMRFSRPSTVTSRSAAPARRRVVDAR
jgi:hypothetical protein